MPPRPLPAFAPSARAALIAAAALALAPAALPAQEAPTTPPVSAPVSDAATLLADRIEITGQNRITASGNVEVYWQEHRLNASRLVYDESEDRLTIEGPIRMVEPGVTGSVIVADQADLSRDLQNGVMLGARMVLSRELQLAANRLERQDGTRTILREVVASSCRICAADPTPLWEIRARTITHDATTHQLVFDQAQFRAMGVPLVWLPKLRMPDPTVKRMTGLLRPEFRTTSLLGPGVKLPYFFALSPERDLTLTPYLAASHSTTLGFRYRVAQTWGSYQIEGALSRDSIRPGERRGYLFADGRFALPGGFTLGAQLRTVSDPSYLLNYDITDDDRLWSGLTLERVRADELIWAKVGNTHSLRDGESNSTQPMLSGDASWTRVFQPRLIGGELSFSGSLHAHRRASDLTTDAALGDEDTDLFDTESDGRDMVRLSAEADWRRNWLLPGGVLAAAEGALTVDAITVRQDAVYAGEYLRALPTIGVELRWPWVASSGRAAQVIEPVAQLVWSGKHVKDLPYEDSWLTEFDEGNLFSLTRYPGEDAREQGTRANLGLSWTRHDASGWSLGVTAGRIYRLDDLGQFTPGSGLSGKRSDWLIATHLSTAGGLILSNRALLTEGFDLDRDELRVAYLGGGVDFAAGYLWMEQTAYNPETSELLLESGWDWRPGWRSTLSTRYDLTADRAAKAAFGLQYANECISVELSLSRRFTSSSSVEPETDLGLSVQLAGFGAQGSAHGPERVCRR
ncbi:LPS-assembly protein [Rhodobacter maris]|uniref:LPS-assembly protein LptD n=2 Tax=Rhodobacter maris TaxID=446682 RepID=A0A285RZK1_9RHOB|nr:LPS-assembly protein [Rhodobacter maris]